MLMDTNELFTPHMEARNKQVRLAVWCNFIYANVIAIITIVNLFACGQVRRIYSQTTSALCFTECGRWWSRLH